MEGEEEGAVGGREDVAWSHRGELVGELQMWERRGLLAP